MNTKYRCVIYYLLCSLFCIISSCTSAQDTSQTASKQLDAVKNAIASEQHRIKLTQKSRHEIEQALKADDIAIATVVKKLNKLDQQLIEINKQLKQLNQEQQKLTIAKNKQEQLLAKQIQTAYTSGQHNYLKLLLNQEEPSEVQRSLVYYQYLNKARIDEIDAFKSTIAKLVEVMAQRQKKSQQLAEFKTIQQQQQQVLITEKIKRSQTINALNKQLTSSKDKLTKLITEESNLVAALEELRKLAKKNVKLMGLNKLRNTLLWPVKGKIQHTFGSKKQGYLKWKGVLLSAPVGRQVNSIYNGTVLFSDWLKGYGLVTVVDHGEGYMSLYGHNQALLKNVGDRVETGEPIALVGQSGGQSQASLYFEIRYKGQAINPKSWCK
jgi:septal ring factor EnvC (AmiA/AmiB activator)